MKTILITGANRGLGLEFTRQYLQAGDRVIACCRNPAAAKELAELGPKKPLVIHPLDVNEPGSIEALRQATQGQAIDILLNNAGMYGERSSFGSLDYADWQKVLATNVLGPVRVTEALVRSLAPEARLIYITSKMGSIADNTSGGSHVYRSSKAALNAAVKSIAIEFAADNKITALLHPGWVQTDMGGPNALITSQESVTQMRRVIAQLSQADNGHFFNYDGKEIPW